MRAHERAFAAYLAGLMMLALSACGLHPSRPAATLPSADWQAYKSRFVSADGRVVDNGNGGISHSEGQGYGMLLAVAADDRRGFEIIRSWTSKHLQLRNADRLHAWKWSPESGIVDMNNATDGDMLIAWALLRADRRWQRPDCRTQALAILASLRKLEVELPIGGVYLLPGAKGFGGRHGAVLNPSYLLLPALRDFAEADPEGPWQRLYADGIRLLQAARFGQMGLTADWVRVDARVHPAPGRPHRFGYDAIRVPLFAAWAGERALLDPYLRLWEGPDPSALADWVDLRSNRLHRNPEFSAPAHIAALARRVAGLEATLPPMQWRPGITYYDASLSLLARLAWMEQER